MPDVINISGGRVEAVYSDRIRPLLEALGEMVVTRASHVEFDHSTGDWVAVTLCGEEIARGKNREEVIQQEVEILQRRMHEQHRQSKYAVEEP